MIIRLLFSKRKTIIILLIILVALVMRGSTLIVDFYDVDELTDIIMVSEIVDGGKAYLDAIPGRPMYSLYIYFVFLLFGSGNIFALHSVTILWVLITCYFLYKINEELFSKKAGYFAALFYATYVSGCFEYYLAVHGEVIYNLPVTLSFYFLVLAEKNKKTYLNYFIAGFLSAIAFFTKGQTILLVFLFAFYMTVGKTFVDKGLKNFTLNIKKLTVIAVGFVFAFSVFIIIALKLGVYEYAVQFYISGNLWYALSGFRNLEILFVIKKVSTKILQNALCQFPLWLLMVFFFSRVRPLFNKDYKVFIILSFFCFSFSGIFLGGLNLYNHYFMQYLPALCLISGYSLTLYISSLVEQRKRILIANILILLPIIFFPAWNYYNAYQSIYNPGKAIPLNHGVIPRETYKNVSQWIKENSTSNDRIIQWGDCIEIYFFAKRKPGIRFLWCDLYALKYQAFEKKNLVKGLRYNPKVLAYKKSLPENKQWTFNSGEDVLYSIILDIDRKRPRYIIDTSLINFRDFNYPLEDFPILFDYIQKHYNYIRTIDKMKIYEKKSLKKISP